MLRSGALRTMDIPSWQLDNNCAPKLVLLGESPGAQDQRVASWCCIFKEFEEEGHTLVYDFPLICSIGLWYLFEDMYRFGKHQGAGSKPSSFDLRSLWVSRSPMFIHVLPIWVALFNRYHPICPFLLDGLRIPWFPLPKSPITFRVFIPIKCNHWELSPLMASSIEMPKRETPIVQCTFLIIFVFFVW